jgi:hypothetical protein
VEFRVMIVSFVELLLDFRSIHLGNELTMSIFWVSVIRHLRFE